MIKQILSKAKITRRHFNYLLKADRNATPATAKRLGEATGSHKEVWVFGTSSERKAVVQNYLAKEKATKTSSKSNIDTFGG